MTPRRYPSEATTLPAIRLSQIDLVCRLSRALADRLETLVAKTDSHLEANIIGMMRIDILRGIGDLEELRRQRARRGER